jgi:hypothetical protein
MIKPKKILIMDKIRNKPMSFVWKGNIEGMRKYDVTKKAIEKAQREGKVDIIYDGDMTPQDIDHYRNQGVDI